MRLNKNYLVIGFGIIVAHAALTAVSVIASYAVGMSLFESGDSPTLFQSMVMTIGQYTSTILLAPILLLKSTLPPRIAIPGIGGWSGVLLCGLFYAVASIFFYDQWQVYHKNNDTTKKS